ncbi:MAG: TIM barrel protein [Nanoarchaeota archaeon]
MAEDSYWDTDYWHSMDRVSGKNDIIDINPSQFAISHGIGDPLQGLKGNIFVGASQVELGFMGQGKGSRSQPTGWTPESVSRSEREDIRQLAKINEVQLSIHATPNVAISGITEQGFNEAQSENALFEVKKAIEFAADTANGGPVVLHAQEFPRSIVEYYKEEKFTQYPREEKKAIIPLADSKTGQLVQLRRDIEIAEPVLDEKGEPIRNEEGKIKVEMRDFDYYQDKFNKLSDKEKANYSNNVGKYFYSKHQQRQIEQAEGQAEYYDRTVKELEKDEIAFRNIKKEIFDKAKNKEYAADLIAERLGGFSKMTPEDIRELKKDPDKFMDTKIKDLQRTKEGWREGVISALRSAEETRNTISRIKPIEEVGVERSAEAIARAAMFGYNIEKQRRLDRPITIVPENWTPEVYGSHPKELKKLVQESRKEMVDMLVKERDMSKKEAQEIAQERIKATFDIGHLNMWRKYFQGTDKEFKKWVDDQVEDLTKNKILGHVHITDNFGYHDEHLTPGEGTAPVKELLRKLEKKGYKGIIVAEPGGQPEGQLFRSLTGAFKVSNFPIYRVDSTQRSWTDVEGSYFGKTSGPTFVVGDYAPSKDWTLWSETPLE